MGFAGDPGVEILPCCAGRVTSISCQEAEIPHILEPKIPKQNRMNVLTNSSNITVSRSTLFADF